PEGSAASRISPPASRVRGTLWSRGTRCGSPPRLGSTALSRGTMEEFLKRRTRPCPEGNTLNTPRPLIPPLGGHVTDIVIGSACRTPIGKYGKALRNVEAVKLGSIAIAEAVSRASLHGSDVDEVIMGNVISAGLGQNPARQAALLAGIPDRVGAVTVNKVCASGMKAVAIAADAIKAGSADAIVAGGMESMSRAPYLVKEARWGIGYNHVQFLDSMIYDGLWDVYNQFHMGVTGEIVSERFHVTREEMDRFALESHHRALKAINEGKCKAGVV